MDLNRRKSILIRDGFDRRKSILIRDGFDRRDHSIIVTRPAIDHSERSRRPASTSPKI